ncbi:auxin response factor 1 [Tanacetum coccineum]
MEALRRLWGWGKGVREKAMKRICRRMTRTNKEDAYTICGGNPSLKEQIHVNALRREANYREKLHLLQSVGAFVLLSISTFFFMGHIAAEGCLWLVLGALLNVIGVSKKKHYPSGIQSGPLGTDRGLHASWTEPAAANNFFTTKNPLQGGKCSTVAIAVEEDSEQVYTQITLLPHQDQSEVAIHNPPMPEPPCCNVCSFDKTPTARDTSAPGGLRKNTHISVLATAHHAITAGTLFSVIYKPRATQSSFIISVNRYLNAQNPKPCVGMKFTMGFESEMVREERFGGIIVAVGDDASSEWRESEWKSLKVQWDEPSPILPDRVSLWEIKLRPSQMIKGTCCCLQGLKVIFGGGRKAGL